MDGIISLSSDSGSEEDSEIEFVGSYSTEREDPVPFVRGKLLPVTPVLIDITGHQFSPVRTKHRQQSRRGESPTIEVIDLNNYHLSGNFFDSDAQLKRITADITPALTKNRRVDSSVSADDPERDVICLDSVDSNDIQSPVPVSSDQEKRSKDQCDSLHSSPVDMRRTQKSGNISHYEKCTHAPNRSEIKVPEHLDALQIKSTVQEELQNTKLFEQTFSSAADHSAKQHKDEPVDFPQRDKTPSPFSLDSPYYFPSETEDFIFSEESNAGNNMEQLATAFDLTSVDQTDLPSGTVWETTDLNETQRTLKTHTTPDQSHLVYERLSTSDGASPTSSLPCAQPCSPTSTEILAGDSPDTLASSPNLSMESPPSSPYPHCQSPKPPITEKMLLHSKDSKGLPLSGSPSPRIRPGMNDEEEDGHHSESPKHGRQHISLGQFKRLKHLIGGGIQEMPVDDEEEDDKDFGQAEPLCRQSLSLVYSTIEESYPEGTLQLLSDLIQPRYYPPGDITVHLLRGILLEPRCAEVLALEAYNLLMRTQKYHPADVSTVPWDWDLLTSVMSDQDEAMRLRSEIRCLLFQYVLQVLEDDFHFKLPILRLHLSIAKTVLSCDQKFRQVRDVMNWLLEAAKESFCHSEEDGEMQKKERNCSLKMLLILQRMLLLAMEVDRTPTCSANKLSQELCNSLNSTSPCRQLRLLLLSTLESNLLRCKLLEQLLDQACSLKKPLPMSFRLLLHFLQTSTLAPDPADGTERWRKWDELLQLLWMLMLSYEEVMTGHLRSSITERFTLTRAPIWTQNDQVTRAAVQEAAEAFLSRASQDTGHALPTQMHESLSLLQRYLLNIRLQ